MDQQAFELVKDRFDKIEQKLEAFELKVEAKIDELMRWKWSVYGITLTLGVLGGIVVNVFYAWVGK